MSVAEVSTAELRDRSGLSQRQVEYWRYSGVLQGNMAGSGFPVRYPASELVVAATLARVVRLLGKPSDVATKELASLIRQAHAAGSPSATLSDTHGLVVLTVTLVRP